MSHVQSMSSKLVISSNPSHASSKGIAYLVRTPTYRLISRIRSWRSSSHFALTSDRTRSSLLMRCCTMRISSFWRCTCHSYSARTCCIATSSFSLLAALPFGAAPARTDVVTGCAPALLPPPATLTGTTVPQLIAFATGTVAPLGMAVVVTAHILDAIGVTGADGFPEPQALLLERLVFPLGTNSGTSVFQSHTSDGLGIVLPNPTPGPIVSKFASGS
mmetsp:Transcript_32639/g.51987  ORF Transcript_32639/g.51987 Transcript_32639/m.51987 type:complete len:218 (-) Transcript_32639:130-783(-)